MQVVNGDQNGCPVPGGLAVPSCRGVYKYGELALQVRRLGDRPTGRQPVAARKLTVRKPKLWPRKSQAMWNRPGQWKVINEMRIATWNVRPFYRGGAMSEVVEKKG